MEQQTMFSSRTIPVDSISSISVNHVQSYASHLKIKVMNALYKNSSTLKKSIEDDSRLTVAWIMGDLARIL